MSLISWLFPSKPAKASRPHPTPESSGLSRMEATRPVGKNSNPQKQASAPAPSNAQAGNRKNERMARRELLYSVVREAMVHAGVLSASYKFKVLSLDARGRQFLVMMDLAREFGGETGRLAEIEAMIAQSAKSRYDIVVTAVYWRMNEHVAVGQPQARAQLRPALSHSAPMPLESQPAVLHSQPAPLVAAVAPARTVQKFEPLEADEVAAFKRALAQGAALAPVSTPVKAPAVAAAATVAAAAAGAHAKAFDGSGKHGPQSYTLLTGFEDTEMPDAEARTPALSGTQYGELN